MDYVEIMFSFEDDHLLFKLELDENCWKFKNLNHLHSICGEISNLLFSKLFSNSWIKISNLIFISHVFPVLKAE